MSQHEIQPYEPVPLTEPTAGTEPLGPDAASGPNLGRLALGMLRRWRIILLVLLLVAPISLAGVWQMVQPYFTATALVEVSPLNQAILFPDASPIMPNWDTFLYTQVKVIGSRKILTADLADPTVKDLPVQQSSDPATSLYTALSVSTVPRSQLLEISVRQENRDAALRLTRAILDAYMARAGGQDSQNMVRRRELLLSREQELRKRLTDLKGQIDTLAAQAGTASDTIFDLRRQGLEKSISDARQRLEDLDLQILDLENQIKQLDNGVLPPDLATLREQMIDADPGVRWVKKEVDEETAKLTRLRLNLPDNHKDVLAVRKNLDLLEQKIEQERDRAAGMTDREIQRKHQQRLLDARQRLASDLAGAKQKREMLEGRLSQRDAEGLRVGQQGLQIKDLTEQRIQAKADLDRIVETLKQLETESQRPTRISVASPPEIYPDGIKDKRMKLSLVVLVLAMGLACSAALVRDLLDPHVHDTGQVEASLGLRMLGAIPSVKELQSGRISKEHFLESYRLIRTSLASLGTDGTAPKSMLITSAQAAEGKTSLAVSLAISLAEPGGRVLLIDGDIQAPQIARLLNVEPHGDLCDVLLGQRDLHTCAAATGIRGLDVLPGHCNGHSARTLLNTRSARQLVRQAMDEYDHVIVDSPPTLGAADALVWAHAVEGVIVTSLVGYSDRKAIKLACQRLLSVGARLLGSVVANVSVTEAYYSYSQTSRSTESSLALANHTGPAHREPPLVHLPQANVPRPKRGKQ